MTLKLAERVATSQTWLDGVSDRLQPIVRDAVAASLCVPGTALVSTSAAAR
jgi:hypothetical protein